MKVKGILTLMKTFSTFLVLNWAITFLSNTSQCNDTSFQEAMAAVTLAKSFYKSIQKEEEYNHFYDRIVRKAETAKIDSRSCPPCLPRYRRAPRKVDAGSSPHQFTTTIPKCMI